jgi:hypothetical protein
MTLLNVSDNSLTKVLWAVIKPRLYAAHSVHSGNVRVVTTSEFVTGIEFERSEAITPARQTSLAACDANGKWYWDREASKVYFYYDGSNANIVLVLGIFLNTNVDRLELANLDGDAFGDLIVYEGRLRETSFLQSCDDILSGKLGIYSTNISVINTDSKFNEYATDDISFKNASVKIWLSINDIDNRIVVFNGLCESASFGRELNLSIVELTKAMQQEATFGDSRSWSTINATRWPDSKEEDRYKVIPMILSNTTRKTGAKTRSAFYSDTDPPVIDKYCSFFDVDPSYDLRLKLIGTEPANAFFEAGKKFLICRCAPDEFPQNFHRFVDKSTTPVLIDGIDDSDISYKQSKSNQWIEYSVNATSTNINLIDFLYAGMLVYMRNVTDGVYHNMVITFVDTTNKKFGLRYWIAGGSFSNFLITGKSYQLHYWGPTVYTMIDNIPCYLDPKQYHFVRETTDGGNSLIYCVINIVVGTGYEALGYLREGWKLYFDETPAYVDDVPELEYYCRFFNFKVVADRSTMNIAKVLNYATRKIPEIDTDSTSDEIVSGNSFYDFMQKTGQYTYIDIYSPEPESTENESYLQLIEKCLASTMSYMAMDSTGKLILRMFENQPYNTIALDLTEDDIVDGSVSSNIDFSEIASTIDASPVFSQDTGVFSESEKVRRISGEIKYNFNHYLKSSASYSDIVKDRLESYKLLPVKRYAFTIINKGYELTLGDRINLQFTDSGKWLGSDTVKELFVVKINKALSGVQVECIENTFVSN